jgi:hypothetical protein
MPNASTWFPPSSPDPTLPHNTRSTAAGTNDPIDDKNDDDDDEDDLAVASERISIKCPLTLLPMKDPVTSQKCPHSFEKEAILSMLGASDVWVGGSGRRGDGQRGMKCPVCEVVRSAHLTSTPISIPLSISPHISKPNQSNTKPPAPHSRRPSPQPRPRPQNQTSPRRPTEHPDRRFLRRRRR